MNTSNRYLIFLLFIYLIFSLNTLDKWRSHDKFGVTGDEPHYLVMTSGLVKYLSFEQTRPYRDEFHSKAIYP
ncbi:MAG TPA: hypothetical protein VFM46_05210, partial [Pseudomonadales bacterium]|nr:hypothetical protein [Pseudomonadales bacterium]